MTASALTATSIVWTVGSCLAVALRGQLSAPWQNVGSESLVSYQCLTLCNLNYITDSSPVHAMACSRGDQSCDRAGTMGFRICPSMGSQHQTPASDQALIDLCSTSHVCLPHIACSQASDHHIQIDPYRRGAPCPPPAFSLPAHDRRHSRSQHPCSAHYALGADIRVSDLPQTLPPNMPRQCTRRQQHIAVLGCTVEHAKRLRYKRAERNRQSHTKHQYTEQGKEDGALTLRADHSGFTTKIVSEKKQARVTEAEAEDGIELLPMSRIRVKMTTTMTSS